MADAAFTSLAEAEADAAFFAWPFLPFALACLTVEAAFFPATGALAAALAEADAEGATTGVEAAADAEDEAVVAANAVPIAKAEATSVAINLFMAIPFRRLFVS